MYRAAGIKPPEFAEIGGAALLIFRVPVGTTDQRVMNLEPQPESVHLGTKGPKGSQKGSQKILEQITQQPEDPVKAQKRRELIEGSDTRLREALSLLRRNPSGEDWHIFEGTTQPDVFIQTPDLIIVIEGKRTERETTKNTKWMSGRHQMWRHIDCAWEIKGKREVFGFLIVESDGENDQVPARWIKEADITRSQEALASSLPHRGPEEREEIHQCFIGVTTWQKVCKEFGIDWDSLPNFADG